LKSFFAFFAAKERKLCVVSKLFHWKDNLCVKRKCVCVLFYSEMRRKRRLCKVVSILVLLILFFINEKGQQPAQREGDEAHPWQYQIPPRSKFTAMNYSTNDAQLYCKNHFLNKELPIEDVLRKYDVAVREGNVPFKFVANSCEFILKLSDWKLTAIAGEGKQYFPCSLNYFVESLRRIGTVFKLERFPNIFMCYNTGDSAVPNSRENIASFCLSSSHIPPQFCKGSIVLPLHANQQLSKMANVLENGLRIIKKTPWRKRKNNVVWRGGANEIDGEQLTRLKDISTRSHNGVIEENNVDRDVLEWGNAMTQWRLGAFPSPRTRLVNASKEFGALVDASFEEYDENFLFGHKYVIALDGYGPFSAVLKRSLGAGSVTLRVAHYSGSGEWYEPFLEEFKHFIPVRYDMRDLKETIEWLESSQEKYIERISSSAREIAEKIFTPTTMHCYTLLVLHHFSKQQRDRSSSFDIELKKARYSERITEFDLKKRPRENGCQILNGTSRVEDKKHCEPIHLNEALFLEKNTCSD